MLDKPDFAARLAMREIELEVAQHTANRTLAVVCFAFVFAVGAALAYALKAGAVIAF